MERTLRTHLRTVMSTCPFRITILSSSYLLIFFFLFIYWYFSQNCRNRDFFSCMSNFSPGVSAQGKSYEKRSSSSTTLQSPPSQKKHKFVYVHSSSDFPPSLAHTPVSHKFPRIPLSSLNTPPPPPSSSGAQSPPPLIELKWIQLGLCIPPLSLRHRSRDGREKSTQLNMGPTNFNLGKRGRRRGRGHLSFWGAAKFCPRWNTRFPGRK